MAQPPHKSPPLLGLHEGAELFSASEAILKGLLESETAVSLVIGPRSEPFAELFGLDANDAASSILRDHEIQLKVTPSAARGIKLALDRARSGGSAVALVPLDEVGDSAASTVRSASVTLADGGALVLLFEDSEEAETDIRRSAAARGMPMLEPSTVAQLRDWMEAALRLSRTARRAVGIIAHTSVLRSSETIIARPNRVIDTVDAMLARRRSRRRPRLPESLDVLRVVRRLEVNQAIELPSPGERAPLGFVTSGPATNAMRHLVHALNLVGRLPRLELGAISPLDETAVARMLSRCEQVVVLETQPGAVETAVLEVVEAMRQRGERPGTVWGRRLPSTPDGRTAAIAPGDALHPSRLARRIFHLIHMIRPSGDAAHQLAPETQPPPGASPDRELSVGAAAALASVRRVAVDVDQWLREREAEEDVRGLTTALAIDGSVGSSTSGRVVPLETWEPARFRQEAAAAIAQAAREDRTWIFVVCDVGSDGGHDLERFARGVVPGDCADRVAIETANFNDRPRLVELLRESALADRMTVIVVGDGPPARYDVAAIERAREEIDRLGFEPLHRVVRPADLACAVRRAVEDEAAKSPVDRASPVLRSSVRVDRMAGRRSRVRLLARPRLEEIEVLRIRPPTLRWRDPAMRLPLPEIIHRTMPLWRCHLAGTRGRGPGVATVILAGAGRGMGYDVRCLHDPRPIAAARRAWAQVLFTRPRAGEPPPALSTRIPFGEADVLVGLDPVETLRALDSDAGLRVASAARTHAIVNSGESLDDGEAERVRAIREDLVTALRASTRSRTRLLEDFAEACRMWFHTDRVTDVALLGAAFQSGLIPVSLEAIEGAVAGAQTRGFGRAVEAFQFGRQLAVEQRLFTRPKDEREENVARIARRMVHMASHHRVRGRDRAARLRRMLEESLERMPGLAETDTGRQARRDFVVALQRCVHWGGIDYATAFVRLVDDLYHADRGDTGRALTRYAVLPLAEVMLIRDHFFVATTATSAEQRRWTRQMLNVKHARGDELSRRYLTRFEFMGFGRRVRADVRTSDWAARLVALLGRIVPDAWRGSRRERELRRFIVDLVERAARCDGESYERFHEALLHLHQQAVEHRLRGMAISEVRMLVGECVDGSEAEGAVAGT